MITMTMMMTMMMTTMLVITVMNVCDNGHHYDDIVDDDHPAMTMTVWLRLVASRCSS